MDLVGTDKRGALSHPFDLLLPEMVLRSVNETQSASHWYALYHLLTAILVQTAGCENGKANGGFYGRVHFARFFLQVMNASSPIRFLLVLHIFVTGILPLLKRMLVIELLWAIALCLVPLVDWEAMYWLVFCQKWTNKTCLPLLVLRGSVRLLSFFPNETSIRSFR